MKKVVYNVYGEDKKEYFITDSEFKKAVAEWSQNRPYWCDRIEAMLQKNFSFLETPAEHIGMDKVLYDPETREEYGVLLDSGKLEYFLLEGHHRIPASKQGNFDQTLPRLVPMDEYFDSEFNKVKAKKAMTDQEYRQLVAGM